MSLSRSWKQGKRDVDPYADEEGEQKAKPHKTKKKKSRPVGQPAPVAAPVVPPPPQNDDPIVEVVQELDVMYFDTPAAPVNLLKVQCPLEFPLSHRIQATAYTRDDEKILGKVGWKFGSSPDPAFEKEQLKFVELQYPDEETPQTFEAIRQNPDSQYVLISVRRAGELQMENIDKWYTMMPYSDDVMFEVDTDQVEQLMRRQRYHRVTGDSVLASLVLSGEEQKRFSQLAESSKASNGMDRAQFSAFWEEAKGQAPPPNLIQRLFGAQSINQLLSVDDILESLDRIGGIRHAMLDQSAETLHRSVEEKTARTLRTLRREEDEEQDNLEQVEGNEKNFDGDIDDQPELDPDHAHMDDDTRKWGESHGTRLETLKTMTFTDEMLLDEETEEQQLTADVRQQKRLQEAGLLMGESGRRLEHLQKETEGIDNDSDSMDDEEDGPSPPANVQPPPEGGPSTSSPPPSPSPEAAKPPAKPPPKKRARDAGSRGTPPPRRPRQERQERVAGDDSALMASIDVSIRKVLVPGTPMPLESLQRSVIQALPQYKAKRTEAKKAEENGRGSAAALLRPFVDQVREMVTSRVNALGGTVRQGMVNGKSVPEAVLPSE